MQTLLKYGYGYGLNKIEFRTSLILRPFLQRRRICSIQETNIQETKQATKSGEVDEISEEELSRLAHLSRLDIQEEEERKRLRQEIARILNYTGLIQAVDTSNVKPLLSLLEDHELPLREDSYPEAYNVAEQEDEIITRALCNSKTAQGRYFVVPKVIALGGDNDEMTVEE
jgi:aspartyl/glutamyl-tRNA(Asn/Gln) amidotransferase C subunit